MDVLFSRTLQNTKIHFFSDEEENDVAVRIEPAGDKLVARYMSSGQLLRPTANCEPYLYIFDLQSNLYVADEYLDNGKYGKIKHTGLTSGLPVLSAGEIFIGDNGSIEGINFSSGHYYPSLRAATFMHHWMENQGLNTSAVRWMAIHSWKSKDCDKKTKWSDVDIEGFDGKLLHESCNKVAAKIPWPVKRRSEECLVDEGSNK